MSDKPFQYFFTVRNGIETARFQRIAANKPSYNKKDRVKKTVFFKRFYRVGRTRRGIDTPVFYPDGNVFFIKPDQLYRRFIEKPHLSDFLFLINIRPPF